MMVIKMIFQVCEKDIFGIDFHQVNILSMIQFPRILTVLKKK